MTIVFAMLVLLPTVLSLQQADYYWRNFDGEVPDDAFKAGRDSSGNPIYIGQGLFLNNVGLLPGTLHAGSPNITVTASMRVFSTNKYVKILCTTYPNNFRWVHVSGYSDISRLSNAHLVKGGVETDSVVYIGRALHEGNTEIGKIYKLSPSRVFVYFPNREGTETSYGNFDILVYVWTRKEDYYWRNFDGKVPDDAFKAGRDSSGNPIYIGQGLFLNNVGLLPGTLHAGSTNITVTASMRVFSTNKYVKILCTTYPNNFRWVQVSGYSDISRLSNDHLVEGGVETDSVVYIGRALHEGDTEIGKIYKLGPSRVFVYFPNSEGTETSYGNFDILVYAWNSIDPRYKF